MSHHGGGSSLIEWALIGIVVYLVIKKLPSMSGLAPVTMPSLLNNSGSGDILGADAWGYSESTYGQPKPQTLVNGIAPPPSYL